MHTRIVPWSRKEELDDLKQWFFQKWLNEDDDASNKITDMRIRAIERVNSYTSRGSIYLPHVIATTSQLTASILLDEKFQNQGSTSNEINEETVRLSYTMAIIRFVNGLLDPSQQSVFAIPLHVLAKKINLPSWLVDLRHCGTHERELVSLEMLRMACKESLKWLWNNYWNDEQLDEASSDEDIEEKTPFFGIDAEDLIDIINVLVKIKDLLIENVSIWESQNMQVIRSKNFSDDHEYKNKHGNKKRKRNDIPVSELINNYISTFRNLWKKNTNKQLFIYICVKHYDSIIFDIGLKRLPEFDYELLKWLIETFSNPDHSKVKNNVIELLRVFKSWDKLDTKVLKPLFENINYKAIPSSWSKWKLLIEAHPNYLSLYTYQSMIALFKDSNMKTKKKHVKKAIADQINAISETMETFIGSYNGKFKKADVESFFEGRQKVESKVSASTIISKPTKSTNVDSILEDLANLKQKTSKKPKLTTSPDQSILIFQDHPNWEPKPFGIL
ncbi:hypothetical protein TPHA_0A02910 [Tetrapisispora phaffii CBS 4417]|uniref:Las1p n=1 Tax=Tetrapisispora phaffii (strain ATCC 24235 / CBS 4417 / NBRC 1672 / NRRL Y-8282 / UCD 70-5) TaxID=1071381 RepID=G8BN93_TETPH|nr:hypothetical protein TPHA_0A02910 [Tetrapisispora phaffii CBS 4417]CCE61371.1 hypothetical protein TPHA_0A02910 [Tetrapisispora phaffii CBS 4417]